VAGCDDIRKRIVQVSNFIKYEKRKIITKELEVMLTNTNVPIFLQMLKNVKLRIKAIEENLKELITTLIHSVNELDSIF
jgi:hypothetical protein